jgi:hypothetical protein
LKPKTATNVKDPISIHIEQKALDLLYAHSGVTNETVSAILERAVFELVAREAEELSVIRMARFLVLCGSPEEQQRVADFMALLRYEDPERQDLAECLELLLTDLFKTVDVIKKYRNARYEAALRSYHLPERDDG